MLKTLHVGCGRISDAWLSNLTKYNDVDICGIVDLDTDAARGKARKYNLNCPVFSNATEAINKLTPDVVIDNIVPSGRLKLAEISMGNGAHVFSEKPLADSIENAKDIIRLSDKYDRDLFVMQNRRYTTNMLSLKNAIQSGIIGKPGYLGAEFFRDSHFSGFREEMDSPLIIDMAIHTFDQARFLLGKTPVSVYCHEYNNPWSWFRGNASTICIFEFDDESVFSYTGSWSSPGKNTSWDSRWRVVGKKGSCLWDGEAFPECHIRGTEEIDQYHPIAEKKEIIKVNCSLAYHEGCIAEMLDSIRKNKRAQTDCRDNILSLAMVFASVKSAREKRKVYLKELLED